MKKASVWLIVAGVLVTIGLLALVVSMAMSHWDLSSFGSKNYETSTFEIDEDFRDIAIRTDTEDIEFRPSEDGTSKVVFYAREGEKHTAFVENGALTIEAVHPESGFLSFAFFAFDTPSVTVYLPQRAYASLRIEEHTGNVFLPEDFEFESIDISADTGSINCDASSSGPVRIKTDTGNIHVESISAESLELSVSTGRVEVRSFACTGDVSVQVSTGQAILSDGSCQSFTSTGSTGDLTLVSVVAAERFAIERSTGDVHFTNCDAGGLTVRTGTGDVIGSLLTEKIFVAQSGTGRVTVPETAGGGVCKITTDTGEIHIELP